MNCKVKGTIVVLVLLAMLLLSSVGSLGIEFDTNESLKDADASFIGEGIDVYAGASVDIVGDVNGDGYDDILIGAPRDKKSAYNSGQTYLVFGGGSFSMDTSLANANAYVNMCLR